jgi:hypothetical protein
MLSTQSAIKLPRLRVGIQKDSFGFIEPKNTDSDCDAELDGDIG